MPSAYDKDKLRKPSSTLVHILADNTKKFKKSKGLSQESLTEKCNLHRTYIGSVERGERNITLSTLEVIADALEISVPRLLTKGSFKNADEK